MIPKQWAVCTAATAGAQFAVAALFHVFVPLIFPLVRTEYLNDDLYRPFVGLAAAYIVLHPLVVAAPFAWVYLMLHERTNFPGGPLGGLYYGAGLIAVGLLPAAVLVFAAVQLSAEVFAVWLLQGMLQILVAGTAVGFISEDPVRPGK